MQMMQLYMFVEKMLSHSTLVKPCVCFSSGARPAEKLHLKINGQDIKQVTESKYLGLILDSHLTLDSHIRSLEWQR